MRRSLRGRLIAGVTTAVLALSAAPAFADGIQVDGDTIDAGENISVSNCSAGQTKGGNIRLLRNDSNDLDPGPGKFVHYSDGESLTVSASISGSSGITSAKTAATDPVISPWTANGTQFDIPISTTIPAGTANGTYVVTYTVTGQESGYNLSDTFDVVVSCSSAPPSNAAPTIAFVDPATTANEGDTKTFTFSITDAAGDTHSFVGGYPDCGADNVLGSGADAPSINAATMTGTFKCTFVDGLNPASATTVSVQVQDQGSLSSNIASTVITVANVAPTVAAPAFVVTSINCRTEVTVQNISFSDPGVNDHDWDVEVAWGDGDMTSYSTASQGPQPSLSHTYIAPGTYTASVTVTDKDGGTDAEDSSNQVVVNQAYTVDFLPPFDDSTPSGLIVNKMKNGRVVPVKATIYDRCTLSYVLDPAVVTIKVSKTSGVGTGDPVEEYADAGQSSAGSDRFRWTSDATQPGGGFWIYNLDSRALGLVVNNLYRVDIFVGQAPAIKATVDSWAVLQAVK